jgi:hypothetical protein
VIPVGVLIAPKDILTPSVIVVPMISIFVAEDMLVGTAELGLGTLGTWYIKNKISLDITLSFC